MKEMNTTHKTSEPEARRQTAELIKINEELKKEIEKCKQAEKKLKKYQGHLEKFIKKRTTNLQQEIEALKRSEEALRESEEFSKSIIESSRDCIKVLDMEGRLQFINQGGQKLLEIEDIGPYLGMPYEDLWESADREAAHEAIVNARKGYTGTFQGYCPTIKGTPKWWDVAVTLIYGTDGKPHRLLVISRDITDRKRTEENLRKFSRVVEQSPATVLITNVKGIIQYVNPKFVQLTGYSAEEVLGKNPRILNARELPSQRYKELWETIAAGREWHGELCNKKKNGEIYWERASISPVRNSRGEITHFVAVKEDITEYKRMVEELKNAKRAAETANQAKSEFLANMSHEIRTPMNAILGFTEILEGTIQNEQQRQYLLTISASGKSLLRLINDILDLSKIEAGKLELEYTDLDPRPVFKEIEQIFSKMITEKGLTLVIDIDPTFPEALVLDETRLRQVLLNLVGNAVKFTELGSVRISVQAYYTDDTCSSVDVSISVEDTGIGIPEDQCDTIFGAFEQQKGQSSTKYGGTGLGLAVTRRLVEMMGGEISVTSEVGKGSTFTVIIKKVPIAAVSDIVKKEGDIIPDTLHFDEATILIADDVESNRTLLSIYLEQFGFTFLEAENGKEALELAQRYHPDLILMDLKMPVMDGYEATRKLKQNDTTKDIPIIAVTASAMKNAADEIVRLYNGYVRKPFNRVMLISELMKFLKHSVKKSTSMIAESVLLECETVSETLDRKTLERLPELIQILKTKFLARWEELHEMLIMDDVKQFAKKLRDIGQEYHFQPLTAYSIKLSQYAQSYNVAEMEKMVAGFPTLVEQIACLDS